jgi:hypothetical protein
MVFEFLFFNDVRRESGALILWAGSEADGGRFVDAGAATTAILGKFNHMIIVVAGVAVVVVVVAVVVVVVVVVVAVVVVSGAEI